MYKNVKGRILLTRRFFDFYERIPILRGSEGVVEESRRVLLENDGD